MNMKYWAYVYFGFGIPYASMLHRMHHHLDEVRPLGAYLFAAVSWPVVAFIELIGTLGGIY